MVVNKKDMKVVVRGVKKALKVVLEDIESTQEKYPSFRTAIYYNLPKNAKSILDKHEKKGGEVVVEKIIAEAIGMLGGDDVIDTLSKKVLGLSTASIKEAVDYATKQREYSDLLGQLSTISKLEKSSLILSMDYSKGLDERIGHVQGILGELIRDAEV